MPKKKAQLSDENKIIQLLQQRYTSASRLLEKGIGDDAAVIHPEQSREYWLITTDMLLENIDFRLDWTTPQHIGSKSIAVNLSDLAAMGARPRFYTVALALPGKISEHWIIEFYDGLNKVGNDHGAQLIGGDLSRSDQGIVISITAIGESLKRKVVYRSGGKAGDYLYVTGVLGRSAAGLKLLQSGKKNTRSRNRREALDAHHTPDPRCGTGLWLAQSGFVNCMMDLSDGLSMDLPRMCAASGVGAQVRTGDIPVFPESSQWGCDPLELALYGGEDYELLFAVPKSKNSLFLKTYPKDFPSITNIGELTGEKGKVWLIGQNKMRERLQEKGFDHFHQR
jgi:thiamine-monophosphate kinase